MYYNAPWKLHWLIMWKSPPTGQCEDPLVPHSNLPASMGSDGRLLLHQLELLHTPHLHAYLHQADAGLQQQHCEFWKSTCELESQVNVNAYLKIELCKFCDFCCSQPIVLNGVYSAIPYFFLAVFTILAGPLADYMKNHWFSTTFTRKLFTDIGLLSSV